MNALSRRVEALIRPEILALSSYHVPDSTGYIKLDAMENPYDWPVDVVEAWLETLARVQPNRYPDAAADRLKQAIRQAHHIPEAAALLLGNGSDEIIQMILMAVAGRDVTVLAPEPTFVMYRQISRCLGLSFIGVPLRSDFSLDLAAMRSALEIHKPGVIFLAHPNNPTGNRFSSDEVLDIVQRATGLVVVDEAYAPFASHTCLPLVDQYPGLVVMRTLSKLGLAGLRLGYLAGQPAWIDQLDKVRLPYNINVLTQATAEFVLNDPAFLDHQVTAILTERARLYSALTGFEDDLEAYPSEANFILFRLKQADATQVHEHLKAAGILIKNLDKAGPALQGCLRVTVGKPLENTRFLTALAEALSA